MQSLRRSPFSSCFMAGLAPTIPASLPTPRLVCSLRGSPVDTVRPELQGWSCSSHALSRPRLAKSSVKSSGKSRQRNGRSIRRAAQATASANISASHGSDFKDKLWLHILAVREASPLVHNITNYVVMNNSANALLAAGGSPIMSYAHPEIDQLSSICQSLVINIGTLDEYKVTSMLMAADAYNERQKPWVLDPVGAGATAFRTEVSNQLLEKRPSVIRGNAGEVMALAEVSGVVVKGVDSLASSVEEATKAGKVLHQKYGSVVCISGETDIVIGDGEQGKEKVVFLSNGDSLMSRVTGLGCSLSAVTGAFAATVPNRLEAAAAAASLFGVAGEIAAMGSAGPGSLQQALLDKLYNISYEEFFGTVKVDVC